MSLYPWKQRQMIMHLQSKKRYQVCTEEYLLCYIWRGSRSILKRNQEDSRYGTVWYKMWKAFPNWFIQKEPYQYFEKKVDELIYICSLFTPIWNICCAVVYGWLSLWSISIALYRIIFSIYSPVVWLLFFLIRYISRNLYTSKIECISCITSCNWFSLNAHFPHNLL